MMKVSATHLKAHLGRYLRHVRDGRELVVTDRDQPIARLLPFAALRADEQVPVYRARDTASPQLGRIVVRGLVFRGTDTSAMLQEERRRR